MRTHSGAIEHIDIVLISTFIIDICLQVYRCDMNHFLCRPNPNGLLAHVRQARNDFAVGLYLRTY